MAVKKRKMKKQIKLTIYIVTLVLLFSVFWKGISCGKKLLRRENINYTKTSSLNYVTYLKNNTHYENTYLKDDFNLVASLVDYFNIDYNYTYTLSEKIDYSLAYEIDAVLEIYDSDNSAKPIEKKKYTLLEKQTKKSKGQIIKVDIFNQKIKYDTYNAIVQDWKKEISPNANLKISFKVDWIGHSNKLKQDITDNSVSEFNIPISQKTIDIKAPININDSGVIKGRKKLSKGYMLVISIVLTLFLIVLVNLCAYILKLTKAKSKYDLKISKILREFDRAITEAKGEFVMYEGESYIEVKDFMELLDVHDNINEPIIHYANNEDLSVFVIKNGNDTYYTTIKRSDYDD